MRGVPPHGGRVDVRLQAFHAQADPRRLRHDLGDAGVLALLLGGALGLSCDTISDPDTSSLLEEGFTRMT